jgi:phage-related protein
MVRAQLAQLARQVNLKVPVNAEGERLRAQVAAQIRAVESTLRAEIPVDPEGAAEFRRKLAAQVAVAEKTVKANIRVDVDRGALGRLLSFASSGTQTFGKLAGSAAEMGSAVTKAASSGAGAMGGLTGSIGQGVVQLAGMLALGVLLLPLLAGIAGAVLAVGGAITAGIGGLPVLLTAALAPIAAVALGFDGIKRAAAPLRDEVESLRGALSNTFERTMGPVFERLQGVFPVLQAGMVGVAEATSRFAGGLVDVITSEAGLQNIKAALAGVGVFLNAALPGARALLEALLNTAATQPLYAILGETVGGLSERLAGFLNHVTETGLLTESLAQLRDVLFGVSDFLGSLSEGALEFFTGSGPGLTAFFETLAGLIDRIDFAALGESFGGMMERAAAALEQVPPETWQQLADAIGRLADTILSLAEGGGFAKFIEDVAGAAGAVDGLITSLDKVSGALNFVAGDSEQAGVQLSDTFASVRASAGDMAATVVEKMTNVRDAIFLKIGEAAGFLRDRFFVMVENVRSAGEAVRAAIQDGFERARAAVVDKASQIVGFVQSLPGRIRGALGSLGGLLLSAGREVIQGFIDGIQSAFGQVRATLGRLTAMLPSWKGPPARDRSILHGAGQSIIEGLIRGLQSQFPAVRAALLALTGQMATATPLEGLTRGITQQAASVRAAMTALARTAAARFDETLTAGLAGVPGTVADSLRSKRRRGPGPGMVQAEDGSWVPESFYDKPVTKPSQARLDWLAAQKQPPPTQPPLTPDVLTTAIVAAFDQSELRFSGDNIAKIVNRTNLANGRR